MKNYKKIFSLVLATFLLFSIVSFALPTKAEAVVATTPQQVQNAAFEFVNRGLIIADFDGKKVNFVDSNPFDYGLKYVAQGYDCEAYIGGNERMDDTFALERLGNYPGSLNTDYIHIEYNDGKGNGCAETKVLKAPAGVDVGMRTWFNWVDSAAIEIIDGSRLFTKTGNNEYYLYTDEAGKNCQDRVFVNDNSARYFELDRDGELNPSSTDAKNLALGNDCEITGYNFLDSISTSTAFNNYFKNQFRIGAIANKTKPAGEGVRLNGQTSGGVGDVNTDTCESKASALNWIFCPMIGAIDDIFTKINSEVENRLTVNANNFQTDEIKKTWSIFRVIATSVLVIIMLVMVISQAIGTSIFEAYTVRKILPRLVVAAILIQLSLSMFLWVIALANNAGNGIFDLIAIPFGGREQLGLANLIGRLGESVPGGSVIAAMLGSTAVLIFNPFLVLLVAFMIFMAILTAAATLLFREILILACVILGPLALLAWILPGTKRYWTMWWDNFSKALLIFPLIMALIAVGRVFAWVIGSNEGNPGIFDWFGVLIGFFLPYYLLPKTFKWGGTLMSSAGNAINGAMKPISGFGTKEIRDMGQRYQGKWAKDYNPEGKLWEKNRMKRKIPLWGKEFSYNSPIGGRALRRFQSGHFLPTKRSQAQASQKGDKWNEEYEAMASSVLKRGGEKSMPGYDRLVRDEDGQILAPQMNADGTKYLDKDGKETEDMSLAASGGLATSSQIAAYNAAQKIKNDDERKKAVAASGVHVVTATGTDAMKSYWVDKSEDPDKFISKMAMRALLDTRSFPELEGRFTKSGVRVVDLPNWGRNITTSTEHYKATLAGRTSGAPHIKDSAKKKVNELYDIDYDTEIPKLLGSSNPSDIDKAQEIIRVAHAHSAAYAINDQLDNEDFRGLSDGEINGYRRAVMTEDGKLRGEWKDGKPVDEEAKYVLKVRNGLRNRFKAIYDAGPTAAQSMIAPLKNGGPKEKNLNMILGAGEENPLEYGLDTYFDFERGPGHHGPKPVDDAAAEGTVRQEHDADKDFMKGSAATVDHVADRPDSPDTHSHHSPSDDPASHTDPGRYSGRPAPSSYGPSYEGVGPGIHEQRSPINTAARVRSVQNSPIAQDGEVLAIPHGSQASEPPVLVMPTVAISDQAAEAIGKNVAESVGEAVGKQLESANLGTPSVEVRSGSIIPSQPLTPPPQQPSQVRPDAQQREVVEELRALRRQIREMPADRRDPESQITLERIEREHPELKDEDKV